MSQMRPRCAYDCGFYANDNLEGLCSSCYRIINSIQTSASNVSGSNKNTANKVSERNGTLPTEGPSAPKSPSSNASFKERTVKVETSVEVYELTQDTVGDELPELDAVPEERIQLKVKDQTGKEIFFRVNMTTQFSKLMVAYSKAVKLDAIRFFFDGRN